jgi:hypothetical protein
MSSYTKSKKARLEMAKEKKEQAVPAEAPKEVKLFCKAEAATYYPQDGSVVINDGLAKPLVEQLIKDIQTQSTRIAQLEKELGEAKQALKNFEEKL